MSRAPTISPMSALRLGATLCMRSSRYACSLRRGMDSNHWRWAASRVENPPGVQAFSAGSGRICRSGSPGRHSPGQEAEDLGDLTDKLA